MTVDDATVRTCAALARRAYAAPAYLGGFRDEIFLEHRETDTQAYLVPHDAQGVCYLAFRGTQERRDWATNLRAWMVRTPAGWVHAGFLRAWRGIAAEIASRPEAAGALARARRVVFCGHSLGGALATLAAALAPAPAAAAAGARVCVTFGSPRVGGRSFRRAFARAGIAGARYAIQADPVPRVPTALAAYCHVRGGVTLDPNASCAAWVCDMVRTPVDDHDMARYEELVANRG